MPLVNLSHFEDRSLAANSTSCQLAIDHHSKQVRVQQQLRFLRSQFLQGSDLPLSDVLSTTVVMQALAAIDSCWKQRIYSPMVTLWVFLGQELRCKTPELVRKEIWTYILAYNLIRTIMAQAATKHDVLPRTISFKATIQTMEAFQPLLAFHSLYCKPILGQLFQLVIDIIVANRVANRPDRLGVAVWLFCQTIHN